VVGFDDIPGAAFGNPALTTVRQPLLRMGQIAAQTVIERIEERGTYQPEIAIEPEFVIRESSGVAPGKAFADQYGGSASQRSELGSASKIYRF